MLDTQSKYLLTFKMMCKIKNDGIPRSIPEMLAIATENIVLERWERQWLYQFLYNIMMAQYAIVKKADKEFKFTIEGSDKQIADTLNTRNSYGGIISLEVKPTIDELIAKIEKLEEKVKMLSGIFVVGSRMITEG